MLPPASAPYVMHQAMLANVTWCRLGDGLAGVAGLPSRARPRICGLHPVRPGAVPGCGGGWLPVHGALLHEVGHVYIDEVPQVDRRLPRNRTPAQDRRRRDRARPSGRRVPDGADRGMADSVFPRKLRHRDTCVKLLPDGRLLRVHGLAGAAAAHRPRLQAPGGTGSTLGAELVPWITAVQLWADASAGQT